MNRFKNWEKIFFSFPSREKDKKMFKIKSIKIKTKMDVDNQLNHL